MFGAKLLRPKDGQPYRRQEMPFNVVAHLLCQWSSPGERILDAYAGTGVIAMACLRTGRSCVSVEKYDDTKEDALRRLRTYYEWVVHKTSGECPEEAEASNPYTW